MWLLALIRNAVLGKHRVQAITALPFIAFSVHIPDKRYRCLVSGCRSGDQPTPNLQTFLGRYSRLCIKSALCYPLCSPYRLGQVRTYR